MSRQSRHGRFDVWVEIHGQRAQQYAEGVNGRTSACFIISMNTAELAVYVREHKSMTTASARADVFMEGVLVGKAILSPSEGPSCFPGSWLDRSSLRPFEFTTAKRKGSNEDDDPSTMQDAGKIIVKISEVVVLSDQSEHLEQPPPPLKDWQPPPVADDVADLGCHRIVLAKSVKRQKYEPQYDIFESQPFDSSNPQPIATFEFIFGSKEFITTRHLEELASLKLQTTLREHTKLNPISGLPSSSGLSRKRALTNSACDGASSSRRNESAQCTRCADAEVACIPNSGLSSTCQRCRNRRQGCDLPRILELSAENRGLADRSQVAESASRAHGGIMRTYGKNTRDDSRPHLAQKVSIGPTSTDFHSISQTQKSREVDHEMNNGDRSIISSRETAVQQVLRHLFLRNVSPLSSDLTGNSEDDSSEDDRIPANGIDKLAVGTASKGNAQASASGSGSAKPNAMNVDEDSFAAPAEAVFNAGHANQVRNVIRAFSDKLMELMVQGDQQGIVADVARELVKNCDESSRRIQASILQDKMAKRTAGS